MSIFRENLGYKVLALGFAILFWWVLVGEEELHASLNVPVQYRNVPRDLEITGNPAATVRLEVRGPASKLSSGGLEGTAVLLDLSVVKHPGERTFPVQTGNTRLPFGVSILRAVPASVTLEFEKRLAKRIPVRVRMGSIPEGWEVTAHSATPESVEVLGPEGRVAEAAFVETDALDITEAKETVEVRTQVHLSDPEIRPSGDGRVTVRFELRKRRNSED